MLYKHEMVGALQKQCQRLKAENEKLSRAAEGAVGGPGQDDQDGDQTSIKESIDVGYESCNTGVSEWVRTWGSRGEQVLERHDLKYRGKIWEWE